jgi:SAM-dependent methyltransferase
MSKTKRFKERYKSGVTPWDLGRPDANLVEVVSQRPVEPCTVLEAGCGTGTDSIWLAQQGFEVTGVDVSGIAVEKAAEKAEQAGVQCTFLELDFLAQIVPGAPFAFFYDRGCFHSFDKNKQRRRFAGKVAAHLESGGLWLSLVGSADDPPRDTGPPRRSLKDIVPAIEAYFEVLSITAGLFDSNRPVLPRNWICLMRKREK